MVITGSHSKKFGDIYYTFVIFSTNISDFIVERLITCLDGDNYPLYFFITIAFNCFLHFICVYVLIGSRIELLMISPNIEDTEKSKNDITDYVSMYNSKIKYSLLYKKFKRINENSEQTKTYNNTVNNNNTIRCSILND